METSDALQKAIQYHQTGNLIEAENLYQKILDIDPNNFYALHYLGVLYFQYGNHDKAIEYINKAIISHPDAHVYYNLGLVYQGKKLFNKAISSYQNALKLNPEMADAYVNLSIIYKEKMQLEKAIKCLKEALRINPNHIEAYNNLGIVLKLKGQLEKAIECYKKAIQLNPDYAEILFNLAIALQESGKIEEAIEYYKKALRDKPDSPEILYNLGTAYMEQGKQKEAISTLDEVIKLRPYSFMARFAHCIAQIPIIHQDESSIYSSRENYQKELLDLRDTVTIKRLFEIEEASMAIGTIQPFYLAYQGLNDVELQRLYGELVCSIMSLKYPMFTGRPVMPEIKSNGRIRIGFVSGHFYNHSVWNIPIKGWIERLNKERFEIYGYYTWNKIDEETKFAKNCCKKFVKDIYSFEKLCKIIRNDKLHILIYPEIGMDPLSLKLASLRLAPVQCVSWGHPTTTGLPTIDYFLSSELMEPPDADSHYTEKLIRLPNLSAYITPMNTHITTLNRESFNLPRDSVLYHCCQSLYKFLPQYDDIFPLIAKGVDNCRFLFSSHPKSNYITDQFRWRLYKAFDRFNLNAYEYLIFLPFLDKMRFSSLYQISDVFLDPIGWSGCNSAIEAINFNLPIVTFPGNLMRCRDSYAILKKIGIQECIASTLEEYIDLAVHIGIDNEYRKTISNKIAENKYKIFYDMECINALEDFFERVLKER